ncbi:MAG: hypothetical protein V3W20_08315 [Candidatus Neomarinimicrobiota bacterium]
MKELKWIYEEWNNQWLSNFRNRLTKETNLFLLVRRDGEYELMWDSPTVITTVNTFKRLKNAKTVAQLIAFG